MPAGEKKYKRIKKKIGTDLVGCKNRTVLNLVEYGRVEYGQKVNRDYDEINSKERGKKEDLAPLDLDEYRPAQQYGNGSHSEDHEDLQEKAKFLCGS